MDIEKLIKETEKDITRNKLILGMILLSEVLIISLFVINAPSFTEEQKTILFKLPRSPQDFLDLISVVKIYISNSYYYTMSAFICLYLFLQSFGIPGPLVLSIIAGALFGRWVGLVLVVLCSTIGATLCYMLSETLGKGIVIRKFPTYIVKVNNMVQDNKHNLFFYMLFLRLTPILPNWFINISSPIIGISKPIFVSASFFGLIPANAIYINSGMTLSSIHEVGLSLNSVLFLFALGVLSLLPTLIARKHKVKE